MSIRQNPAPETPAPYGARPYAIEVSVEARFVPEQSQPEAERFVFGYTVTLRNVGEMPARLLSRHWIITDAHGKIEEVRGDGVVGEQPRLHPGEQYVYTSGAVLGTSVGTMRGAYHLHADDGTDFETPIPEFVLSIPRTLH